MRFISFESWRKDNEDLENQLKDDGFECYECHGDGGTECPTCYHENYCDICSGEGWIMNPSDNDVARGMKAAYEEQKKADMEKWNKYAID